MAAGTGLLGRDISMTVGGQTLVGVINKDFSVANSAIDVTDDQSSGNRELLAKGGLKSLTLTVTGTVKNYELLSTMFASTQMVACDIDLGDGTTTESNLTFDAFMSDLSHTNPSDERCDFSCTLESSGAITFTAGS